LGADCFQQKELALGVASIHRGCNHRGSEIPVVFLCSCAGEVISPVRGS
jgi:hypothetical protein